MTESQIRRPFAEEADGELAPSEVDLVARRAGAVPGSPAAAPKWPMAGASASAAAPLSRPSWWEW